MPDSQNGTSKELSLSQEEMVRNMHRLFLEALRLREQQIIRYLVILGPGLGGFIWLLSSFRRYSISEDVLVVGTVGTVFLLGIGAAYALALGYNFRCVVMQMAKIEAKRGIRDYVLIGWPREPGDFKTCYCSPPEMIKIFWVSFLVGIVGVATTALYHLSDKPAIWLIALTAVLALGTVLAAPFLSYIFGVIEAAISNEPACCLIAFTAILALGVGLLMPYRYGWKLTKLVIKEEKEGWRPDSDRITVIRR